MHATAAAAVAEGLGEDGVAFARRAYPCLIAQHDYLRRRRSVGPVGLAAVVHPWETGMDNSPAWDSPLHVVPADLSLFDTYTRRDLEHAGTGERPTNEDYARYIRLALDYRDHGYDDEWVRAEGEFCVVDPTFNALWAWAEIALADLAARIGADPTGHRAEATRLTRALVDQLWSAEAALFVARDVRTGQQLGERTVSGLIPLVLPDLPAEIVSAVHDTSVGDRFRVGAAYGVPSFDLTDPRHDPQRYWRGPSWLNTTWLVAQGLRQHGHDDLASRLDSDIVALTARSGLREYFHPLTGTGHGTDRFSWSAALLIDVLLRDAP